MPNPMPDCPRCENPELEVFRADARGAKWAQCGACRAVVLLRADNSVAHVSPTPAAGESARG